ncbi:MAG: hypothetical protein DMG58_06800 [Acidobacteria bacterium]|nr:MAG: hypothetical protein DMG58_06800 [Acidobacteriota bacterium]
MVAGAVVFLIGLAGAGCVPAAAWALQASPVKQESQAFDDFTQRVKEYLTLHKAAESSLPRLKSTTHGKTIIDRQHVLAQKIAEARSNAKQGDIFSPEISEQFHHVIRSKFHGAGAPNIRQTIRQGEPLTNVQLIVNGAYPGNLPLTTVPPTLLINLPQLPREVAYRIVGHDLVLLDTEARIVIDFIPGTIP